MLGVTAYPSKNEEIQIYIENKDDIPQKRIYDKLISEILSDHVILKDEMHPDKYHQGLK